MAVKLTKPEMINQQVGWCGGCGHGIIQRLIAECCEELGIVYSTSVWDLTSAKEIAALEPELIKIPSACNNHYEMLSWLCENYGGEIHVSLGMTERKEEEEEEQ